MVQAIVMPGFGVQDSQAVDDGFYAVQFDRGWSGQKGFAPRWPTEPAEVGMVPRDFLCLQRGEWYRSQDGTGRFLINHLECMLLRST